MPRLLWPLFRTRHVVLSLHSKLRFS